VAQSLYYLLSIIAVFVVIRWYIRNDNIGPGERTSGILGMDPPVPDDAHAGLRRPGAR
jgi:hypothetical protein